MLCGLMLVSRSPATNEEWTMGKWYSEWIIENPGGSRHGVTGTIIVKGLSEPDARESVKDAVSQKLYGTTQMQEHVVVRRLHEES